MNLCMGKKGRQGGEVSEGEEKDAIVACSCLLGGGGGVGVIQVRTSNYHEPVHGKRVDGQEGM